MISIIIPVYNEYEVLQELYAQLNKIVSRLNESYEYVFVNDGSEDNSLELLLKIRSHDQHIKIIDFSRNFGHQPAISAGIKYARGNAIIVMDADLQDPPGLIPKFIEK